MVAGHKKQDKYYWFQCAGPCQRFFHNEVGLNLHKGISRCGRMQKNKLTKHDKEMIEKGWKP